MPRVIKRLYSNISNSLYFQTFRSLELQEGPIVTLISIFCYQCSYWPFFRSLFFFLLTEKLRLHGSSPVLSFITWEVHWHWFIHRPVSAVVNGDVHETSFMIRDGSAILTTHAIGLDEGKSNKRTLLSALIRTYIWFFLQAAVFKLGQDILSFVSPQLLRWVVSVKFCVTLCIKVVSGNVYNP